NPRELFAATFFLTIALSLILVVVGFVVLPYALADDSAEVQSIGLVYLCGYLPIYFAALFLATIFQGHLAIMTWNAVRVLVPVGYLAAILATVLLDHATVAGFAAANIAAHLLSVIIGRVFAARRGWLGFSVRWKTIWGLLVYGIKVHVGEMLNTLRQR